MVLRYTVCSTKKEAHIIFKLPVKSQLGENYVIFSFMWYQIIMVESCVTAKCLGRHYDSKNKVCDENQACVPVQVSNLILFKLWQIIIVLVAANCLPA